jgi:hypothetical protein
MKKLILGITVVLLLAFGAITYAHGPGGRCCGQMMGPGYGAHMMGPGYGGHMMGQGYGGHMMGQGGTGYGYDQKFLDETVEQRRELHNKRFEYFEAFRNPETSSETITKLEKEIHELQETIHKKAPRSAYGKFGRHRCGW